MALDPIVNFFRSTIATLPVASGGTSIVLQTGDGNKLPAPAIDGAFNLTIYNADDPFVAPEIVRVTARSGDTLTVTRAQEGTSATNKTSGSTWNVELTPTAKTIQDIDSAKLDVAGGTMTGDLTIPDKIIHSGDTNTAIRFPANDTVTVETAGSEAFRVDSSQRVGINNTSPSHPLDVTGVARATEFRMGTRQRTFTKEVSVADNTDTVLLTITAPGSGVAIAMNALIYVSVEGRWGGTTRLVGNALYSYRFTKVTGAGKSTGLVAIEPFNFSSENTFLIDLTSTTFSNNNVDSFNNTISVQFVSSGTSTRTFVVYLHVVALGPTPTIIT